MEQKYYIMKYLLKVCGSTALLTPIIYIVLICLLAILPSFQVPDMIGFIYLIYVLPYTALFTILIGILYFMVIVLAFNFASKRSIRIILSVLTAIVIYVGFAVLFAFNPMELYAGNYYLPTIISISMLFFIWYCEFNPPAPPVVTPIPHSEL